MKSTPISRGLPSPAALLFNWPIRALLPKINREHIIFNAEDEHYGALKHAMKKPLRAVILKDFFFPYSIYSSCPVHRWWPIDTCYSGRDKWYWSPEVVLQHQGDENWQANTAQHQTHMQYMKTHQYSSFGNRLKKGLDGYRRVSKKQDQLSRTRYFTYIQHIHRCTYCRISGRGKVCWALPSSKVPKLTPNISFARRQRQFIKLDMW